MPLDDTLATYSYLISELDKLNIAYITLVRYAAKLDVEYDGETHTVFYIYLAIAQQSSPQVYSALRNTPFSSPTDHLSRTRSSS